MAKYSVFISYDYDNDKSSKDQLLGWDANKEIDFSSYDQPLSVAVDSHEAEIIKKELADRIGAARYFLSMVGKDSYRSGWTAWQTRKAAELKKKLVAVRINSINEPPAALQRAGATWTPRFRFDLIKTAFEAA